MITDPKEFVANSGLAGLGSFEKILGSFNVSSQSIGSSSVYQHPVQNFAISEEEFLSTTLFNLSFEAPWRTLAGFVGFTYDTNNVFYVAGYALSNPTGKFTVSLNQSYKNGVLSVYLSMTNSSSVTNPVATPAFTLSYTSPVRAHLESE